MTLGKSQHTAKLPLECSGDPHSFRRAAMSLEWAKAPSWWPKMRPRMICSVGRSHSHPQSRPSPAGHTPPPCLQTANLARLCWLWILNFFLQLICWVGSEADHFTLKLVCTWIQNPINPCPFPNVQFMLQCLLNFIRHYFG